MQNRCTLVMVAVVSFFAAVSAQAAQIIRATALIESMPIQGVTLSMTDEEAFNQLTAIGYTANGVPSFADWTTSAISMVRGAATTPEGLSEISLSRTTEGRIVNISETFNRPRNRFDADAEVQAMRDHFGIPADDPDCKANEHGSGSCRVADAAEDDNAVYGLTVMTTMIMRYASRNKELKDSIW